MIVFGGFRIPDSWKLGEVTDVGCTSINVSVLYTAVHGTIQSQVIPIHGKLIFIHTRCLT
jgi:hypothetical protein